MNKHGWPGLDDKLVVTEMRANRFSPHWEHCYIWVSKLVDLYDISEDLKQDIVQEAMISISKGLSSFHFECQLTTWLTTVVNSKKMDAFRRKFRRSLRPEDSLEELQSISDDGESFEIRAPRTTEDECILHEDLYSALRELQKEFERCSKRDQTIIIRHFQSNQKYSEIADSLGLNPQIVAYVCNRTQQHLQKACQRPPFK